MRHNVLLRDMNVSVGASDRRQIEVLADGLPCRRGHQLAVDVTLRSALSCEGAPRPRAHAVNGAVADAARADKERKYPEFADGRCALVVVAIETGGRWSTEAIEFVDQLAEAKGREAPPALRRSSWRAHRRRWQHMLSISAGKAFVGSLRNDGDGVAGCEGPSPELGMLLDRSSVGA